MDQTLPFPYISPSSVLVARVKEIARAFRPKPVPTIRLS